MRVAIIIPRLEQLGPVKVIQALVNILCTVDQLKIKVFYLDRTVDPQIVMTVPVERLDRKHFCFSDYDIIHTNGIRPDLFAFLNRKRIKFHISTIHNFVFTDLSFSYNRIISLFFGNMWLIFWSRADKLICVSDTMKDYYSKWFPKSKLEVIHNGITETDDSQIPDIDIINAIEAYHKNGYKVVGNASVLTKRKGIDQLLYMVKEVNDIALVVIGNGKELKNLKQVAEKLGIADRCSFCGFRSNAINYFRYFDLFIVPSRSEGFGLTLVEAVQQKVPVICSDISVFKELFNDNEVTFFKSGDRRSLSEAFKTAVETGNKKAEKAYTSYAVKYKDSLMAENYRELYMSAS